jgi:Carboxypeptidase regulatory-like domain
MQLWVLHCLLFDVAAWMSLNTTHHFKTFFIYFLNWFFMSVPSNYKSAQAELYMACQIGWGMCRKNLPAFAAFKGRYTEGYINECLAAITAADDLPDANARYVGYGIARNDLMSCKDGIVQHFTMLLSYISDAYPASTVELMINAAGKPFFDRSKRNIWTSVSALLSAAVPFIRENKVALMANNNMPASFIDSFQVLRDRFTVAFADYNASDTEAAGQTTEKVDANNAVYNAIAKMLDDGRIVFSNNPDMAKEFTFGKLLSQVRSTKMAGFSGRANLPNKGKLIEGVRVSIPNTDRFAVTDENGRYELFPLAADTYTLLFEKEGYEPLLIEDMKIKTGVMTRCNVVMEMLVVGVPVLEKV